mmetsp:Transcript_24405/g.59220  ORF Transcript_24405/g.59220 Transcript_24405/m.59220 type:complete len:302 (-) Transcript_24405:292-1197(-)
MLQRLLLLFRSSWPRWKWRSRNLGRSPQECTRTSSACSAWLRMSSSPQSSRHTQQTTPSASCASRPCGISALISRLSRTLRARPRTSWMLPSTQHWLSRPTPQSARPTLCAIQPSSPPRPPPTPSRTCKSAVTTTASSPAPSWSATSTPATRARAGRTPWRWSWSSTARSSSWRRTTRRPRSSTAQRRARRPSRSTTASRSATRRMSCYSSTIPVSPNTTTRARMLRASTERATTTFSAVTTLQLPTSRVPLSTLQSGSRTGRMNGQAHRPLSACCSTIASLASWRWQGSSLAREGLTPPS